MSDLKIRSIDEAVPYSQSRRSAKLRSQDRICTRLTQMRKKENIHGRELREGGKPVGTGTRRPHSTARMDSDMIHE